MKKIISSLVILLTLFSCNSENHYHDGNYKTQFEVFGFSFANINYTISGNEITIDNSVSGISKLNCVQFKDRIEYTEANGTTRVIYALENGDLRFNDKIILEKIQ